MVGQGALARNAIEGRRLDDGVAVGGSVRESPVVGDREQDVRGVVLSRGGGAGGEQAGGEQVERSKHRHRS